jgi:ferredoxin-like protein FixX
MGTFKRYTWENGVEAETLDKDGNSNHIATTRRDEKAKTFWIDCSPNCPDKMYEWVRQRHHELFPNYDEAVFCMRSKPEDKEDSQ